MTETVGKKKRIRRRMVNGVLVYKGNSESRLNKIDVESPIQNIGEDCQ